MGQDFSTFLFANPSLAEGMARIMDLGNTLNEYNRSLTSEQADFIALAMDYQAIGQDLHRTFSNGDRILRECRVAEQLSLNV